jgi:hypothetical protein
MFCKKRHHNCGVFLLIFKNKIFNLASEKKKRMESMSCLYAKASHPAGRVSLLAGDWHWSVVVDKKDAYGNFGSYDYGLMNPDVAISLYESIDKNLKRMSADALDEEKRSCSFHADKIVPCHPDTCPLGMGRCTCWDEFKAACQCRIR